MPLKLMYITNNLDVAKVAQSCGVDRIFIDMEFIGKEERQKGLDTVKSHHTIYDVEKIKSILNKSELLVRINPIHNKSKQFKSSKTEIDDAIKAGADILMLPMVKKVEEVEKFLKYVNGRVKTMLLIETKEANEYIDDILKIEGVDEFHIGLNDMHLAYKKRFMFELLTDGTVERLCKKFHAKNIPYGFGGIARLGYGMLLSEKVIAEHYRLGSSMAILSRSFCNADKIDNIEQIEEIFKREILKIRAYEKEVSNYSHSQFELNRLEVKRAVNNIVSKDI